MKFFFGKHGFFIRNFKSGFTYQTHMLGTLHNESCVGRWKIFPRSGHNVKGNQMKQRKELQWRTLWQQRDRQDSLKSHFKAWIGFKRNSNNTLESKISSFLQPHFYIKTYSWSCMKTRKHHKAAEEQCVKTPKKKEFLGLLGWKTRLGIRRLTTCKIIRVTGKTHWDHSTTTAGISFTPCFQSKGSLVSFNTISCNQEHNIIFWRE